VSDERASKHEAKERIAATKLYLRTLQPTQLQPSLRRMGCADHKLLLA